MSQLGLTQQPAQMILIFFNFRHFYKICPPFGLNLNIFEIEYILTGADMTPRTELYHGI